MRKRYISRLERREGSMSEVIKDKMKKGEEEGRKSPENW